MANNGHCQATAHAVVARRSALVVSATALVLAALVLAGCGGSGRRTSWSAQQVIDTVDRQTQIWLQFDPSREASSVSVLQSSDDSAGYYNVWVFKRGYNAGDYDIGNVPVPANGRIRWGDWQPLDAENLPGQGTYDVLKTYGNVVLDYEVDARRHAPRPRLPGGFLLLDSALSSLPGFKAGA